MELIKAIQISKSYGIKNLFNKVDFRLLQGQSIALIGPNGAGKTSLIRILTHEEQAEEGSIVRSKGLKVGYVPQVPKYEAGQTIEDFLLQDLSPLQEQMERLTEKMSHQQDNELQKTMEEYQRTMDLFEEQGGYEGLNRGLSTLRALGMDNPEDQKLASLSGGEISLLAFAQALISRPDLLILDEPGNHLDYLGLAWLEQFLASYPGSLLLVSHNRYMLDKVSRDLWFLGGGEFHQFTGRYSDFVRQQHSQAISQQHDHDQSQKRQAELRRRVADLRSIASAGYNAKKDILVRLAAAKKKLAQEEAADPGKPTLTTKSISMGLNGSEQKGQIAIEVKDYSKAFDEKQVLKNISFTLHRGEKTALVGPNGCGKTTLIRAIIEEGDWNSTAIRIGPSFKVGYLNQKSELENPENSIEDEVRTWGPLSRDDAFSLVAPFLFRYEDLEKKLGVLSGGERKRLDLARLIYQQPDLLILDEPTNHMDILSREAIEESLKEFNGTLLVVSHDRYFLDQLVDRVMDLEGGEITNYPGNFTQFFQKKYPQLPRMSNRLQDRGKVRKNAKAEERLADTEQLEQRIQDLEKEKAQGERELKRCYENKQAKEGKDLSIKLQKLQGQLEKLYKQWEEALQ